LEVRETVGDSKNINSRYTVTEMIIVRIEKNLFEEGALLFADEGCRPNSLYLVK